MKRSTSGLLLATVGGLLAAPAAHGQVISIDWFGGGGGGGSTQSMMGSDEVAGVVPLSNWNSLTPEAQATPQPLVDSSGASTGATVTWASNNTWNTGIADDPGNGRMMKGYIDTNDTSTTTVNVSGLSFAGPYDVIVYYDGDNGGQHRVAQFTLAGAASGNGTFWGRDAAGANFAGDFILAQSDVDPLGGGGEIDNNEAAALTVPAGNYMVFSGVTGDSFTISAQASVSSGGTNRAAINGIQIVPEPSSLTLLGLGAAGLLARRRKA